MAEDCEKPGLDLYKTKMDQLAAQRHDLERLSREFGDKSHLEAGHGQALDRLNEFCHGVSAGLDNMSFVERQRFLRLVVDGIVVEDGCIKVETIIPPDHEGILRNVCGELVEPRLLSHQLWL